MRGARRRRDHRTRLQDDLFAVSPVTALRDHHGHDCVPNFHPRSDPRANFIDDPSRVHARHVGRRVHLLLLGP